MTARQSRLYALLVEPTGGWKRLAAALSFGLVAAGGWAAAQDMKPDPTNLAIQAIAVEAEPLAAFDKAEGARIRFGALEWRGGVVLTSSNPNFGGWSGLALNGDGREFLAVSDAGTWLSGELVYDAGGRLSGLRETRIGPLKARDGKTLSKRRDRDAESIVIERGSLDGGTALISFEQHDRIGRFRIGPDGVAAPSEYISMPPEAAAMRMDGFESVAVLAGGPQKGAIVAIAEEPAHGERYNAWIWKGRKPERFSIAGGGGFEATDAKSLADGSLLLLERRFRWTEGVKMRLSRIPAASVKAGAAAVREVLLEADMNQTIDNMEGLALHTNAAGETIVTLISDDNFNKLFQRTLILQFALAPAGVSTEAAAQPALKALP